uniref:ATP synthase epsilon chain, chloroplastic n=1 Tax=Selaginella remotifolia TaxID=137170 RepID=A0A482CGL0_SELRE|nr:ATP synthase CF1 epsilon subunit [Selaginella remotifolia]QBL76290.1 ATP synthase CF1 epsilon subunit [Selaginella remotifolia]
MTLNPRIMTPNLVVRDPEVQEVIPATISGQIGILPDHAPPPTALDIGVLKIRVERQWSVLALMGGFAVVDENRGVTVPADEADEAADTEPQQAKEDHTAARDELARARGGKQTIGAASAFRRAKARLDAVAATR